MQGSQVALYLRCLNRVSKKELASGRVYYCLSSVDGHMFGAAGSLG